MLAIKVPKLRIILMQCVTSRAIAKLATVLNRCLHGVEARTLKGGWLQLAQYSNSILNC